LFAETGLGPTALRAVRVSPVRLGEARIRETGLGQRGPDQGGVQLKGQGRDLARYLAGSVPRSRTALLQHGRHHLLDQ
jgi:hypothetical protein